MKMKWNEMSLGKLPLLGNESYKRDPLGINCGMKWLTSAAYVDS